MFIRQMLHHCGGEHDRAIVVSYVHEYVRIYVCMAVSLKSDRSI